MINMIIAILNNLPFSITLPNKLWWLKIGIYHYSYFFNILAYADADSKNDKTRGIIKWRCYRNVSFL